MSRIGKKIIAIPEKTEVNFVGNLLRVKGPLGELSRPFKSDVSVSIKDGSVTLAPVRKSIESNALWGTYAAHVVNMIQGVSKNFVKKLIIEGIGFRSEVRGDKLVLGLGFSHMVELAIPKGLKVTAEKNVVTVSGIDIDLVGEFVAKVRALKKPEPYKGKGIRYEHEVIRRKEGKKTV
ncbi:50S ribosomal protein L6 [Candidatus Parcubacteria bacterium]|nr:50S ribosomal protein L6 [Candidatus Parcubacteria bacterium]